MSTFTESITEQAGLARESGLHPGIPPAEVQDGGEPFEEKIERYPGEIMSSVAVSA